MTEKSATATTSSGESIRFIPVQSTLYPWLVTVFVVTFLISNINATKCQMRVLGTGVPETRYCRVPGSWYRGRADGVGPAVCVFRPGV
ncbi:hypothetical protein ACL1F6_05840, partial [Corynebacterium striatum]